MHSTTADAIECNVQKKNDDHTTTHAVYRPSYTAYYNNHTYSIHTIHPAPQDAQNAVDLIVVRMLKKRGVRCVYCHQ